ncbi:MAG TPA: hypothetical protein VI942_00890 [Thermoanaerobaculia bacterium]|nr:hypothetical protein [Thermoanaerobaculia bacterium]
MPSPALLPLAASDPSFQGFVSVLSTPWTAVPGIAREHAIGVEAVRWRERLEQGGSAWLAVEGDTVLGAAVLERLAWDSEIFHRPVGHVALFLPGGVSTDLVDAGRALLRRCLDAAGDARLEHLSVRVSAREPAAAVASEEEGFRLLATKLVLALPIAARPVPALTGVTLRDLRTGEHEAFGELAAATSYPLSRFNLEPAFSAADKREFYRRWALDGARAWARWTLVAEAAGSLLGYGLWRDGPTLPGDRPARIVDHTLGGVLPERRREGIFEALTLFGLSRAAEHGYDYQTGVVNVNNLACQRAYLKLGANLLGAHCTLHRRLSG